MQAYAINKGFTLPLFITQQNKVWMGVLAFIVGAIIYLASNHILFFTPRYLPLTRFDQAIPFIPATIWIYLTEYFLFASTYLLCIHMENLNKYLYSIMAMQVFSVIIFMLWPTIYPRGDFPLPADIHSLTTIVFSCLRAIDHPTSCLPSLHISSCYLSSFVFLDEQKSKFWFFFLWATAIGVSTLTTKQHYIIDVIAGLVLAYAFYWIFHRWINYV